MLTKTTIKQSVAAILTATLLFPAVSYADVGNFAGPVALEKATMYNGQSRTVRQGLKMPKAMKRVVPKMQQVPSANKVRSWERAGENPMQKVASASSATLYGAVIYADDWGSSYAPYGLYQIDPNEGVCTEYYLDDYIMGPGTYNPSTGNFYINVSEEFFGMIMALNTFVYDFESKTLVDQFVHDTYSYSAYSINMVYDPESETVYTLNFNEDGSGYNFCTFDETTGEYTVVAPTAVSYVGLAIDGDGQMYGIDSNGDVYSINKATGEQISKVASTGFVPQYMQSACWSPSDNKILWAASSETDSKMIAIDVQAGTSEELCSFSKLEEITCLFSTDPYADVNAPAKPTISVEYSTPGDLKGLIRIVMPTTTVGGEPLEGTMDTQFYIDNELISTMMQCQPGETINRQYTFTEGLHTVRAICVNSVGEGVAGSCATYAGEDAPKAVTNLQLSVSEEGAATLTWEAPTEGVNNGYLNPAKLNYTIARNGEVIAEDVTATTYTDQLGSELQLYYYTVTAYSDDKQGESANTNQIQYGDALAIPYTQEFTDESTVALYTIVDNNKDDNTWKYNAGSASLRYTYSFDSAADDYAMTPPIKMEAGKVYEALIEASSYGTTYTERVALTLGTSTDPVTHTTQIIQPTDLLTGGVEQLTAFFTAPADGEYYVGIHAVSDADKFYLDVYSLSIVDGPSLDAPQAVTEAVATPGAQGALTATISFKAPTLAFSGDPLEGDVTVKVVRSDGVEIGSTTLAPGAEGSITDSNAANGANSYTIYSSNAAGEGDFVTVSCTCGFAQPGPVENLTFSVSEDNMSAVLTWDAPSAAVGDGYFDTQSLTYTIYYANQETQQYEALDETTECTYEVSVTDPTLAGYTYTVTASNLGGESDMVGNTVVLGTPLSVPFEETLANSSLTTDPWYIIGDGSYVTCGIGSGIEGITTASDGGMFAFYDQLGWLGGSSSLLVPKLNLSGVNVPTLRLAVFHYAEEAEFKAEISTDDATYTTLLETTLADGEGWVEHEIDLSAYKDASWVTIKLTANIISPTAYVCLDHIIVDNAFENNLIVKNFAGPEQLAAGTAGTFTAVVESRGAQPASFTVNFSADGQLVSSDKPEAALQKGESETFTFSYEPTVEQIGKNVEMKVEAVFDSGSDEVPDNNVATVQLAVIQPDLPTVTDLTGTADENLTKVDLSWSEPVLAPKATVDGFESYDSFVIADQIGDYVIIDGDGLDTYGLSGVTFPNAGEPMGFMVWSPADAGISSTNFTVYSGSKCLIAFASASNTSVPVNDDWLISPEVIGGTELSFYANIPDASYLETFEVLYSTTTQDRESFAVLKSEEVTSVGWTKYTYTLPDNAKYFAIHYNASDAFALLIDELSFTDARSTVDLTIMGYNVYCNDVVVNESPVSETSYTYTSDTPASELTFNVTVVYDEGESILSNPASFQSGIYDVKSLGIKAYGMDGVIRVENAGGHMVSIYTTDGKLVRTVKVTDNSADFRVDRGIYVVKVDNNASGKVQVR